MIMGAERKWKHAHFFKRMAHVKFSDIRIDEKCTRCSTTRVRCLVCGETQPEGAEAVCVHIHDAIKAERDWIANPYRRPDGSLS